MAVPTITKMQQTAQKMLEANKKQQAASTAATQSGSTSTPTVSTTPKVTQTKKAQPSVQQTTQTVGAGNVAQIQQPSLKSLNLFKPQEQVQTAQQLSQQYGDLLSTKTEDKVESPSIMSELTKLYDTAPDVVGDTIKQNGINILNKMYHTTVRENKFTRAVDNLFSSATIDTARTMISTAQGYLTKEYYSDLLPGKRSLFANMMMPGYALYQNKLEQGLSNTQIGQQLKQQRNDVLEAVFDETEKRDQWLAERGDYKEAKKTADKRAEQGKGIADAIEEGNWDVVTTRVGETIGQMLPSLIAVLATRNPKRAAPIIFGNVFGDSYKRSLLEVNKNPEFDHLTAEQKDNLATLMAFAEAGIESAGDLLELAPFMKGGKFSIADMLGLKTVLGRAIADWQGAAITEGGEEVITEILQNVFKRAYGGSDKATAKELGEIFLDTFLIMQFVGLAGGVKGGIETHRRGIVEKLLEHEAEKFDNFEDFEAEAQRGGVEDEDLIQEAWANAKGLTAEQSATLKRDTRDVQKQEQKSKDLYEEKATVESTLNTLRQSPLKDQSQITKLEVRLQEIDNKLQEIDNKIQEYNDLYGQGNVEVIQAPYVKQEGGKNLSQQTMKDVGAEQSLGASKLDPYKNPQKAIGLFNQINKLSGERAYKEIIKYNDESIEKMKFMLNSIIKNGGNNYISSAQAQDVLDKIDKGLEYGNNVIKGLKLEPNTRTLKEAVKQAAKAGIKGKSNINKITNDFIMQHTEGGKHLRGLKGVEIKNIEGNITDEVVKRFSTIVANAADRLGIDYNKVVEGLGFSILAGEDVADLGMEYGHMKSMFTKEQVEEFLKKQTNVNWSEDDFNQIFTKIEQDIVRSCIALAIKGDNVKAERVLAHEFTHLMEFKRMVDKGLGIIEEQSGPHSYRASFPSVLEGRTDFNTFNWNGRKDYYYYRPKEVWARYNEQYDAYQQFMDAVNKETLTEEDQKVVQDYINLTKSRGYRDQNAFDALLEKRNEIMEKEFSDYLLDEENRGYSKVMSALNDAKFNTQLMTDKELLKNAEISYRGGLEVSNDVENKILQIENQYRLIQEKVDSLGGDISEEIRNGYDIALQDLKTNYDLASKLKDKYIQATKNTKEVQARLDNMVNEISDNIFDVISQVKEVQEAGDIVSDTVTNPESVDNPTGIDTTAPLHEQITQSVDITLKSVDKLVKNKKNKAIIHEVGQGFKNAFTPALSRLYSISPRLAGGVHRYQAMKELLVNSYKKHTLDFVKAMDKLKKKNPEAYKKLSLALFDYGMVDTIEIKEELKKAGIDPKLFEPVAQVLNQIAKDYQAAGLDITVNDKYFPRKVKDYVLLLDYLSMKSGKNIEDTRTTLLKFIEDTNNDPTLSEGEKEKKIHSRLINEFSKPSEMSNNAKERKLVLSEWQLTEEEKAKGYKNDITDFYEEPIVALSMYIEDMVKKTELKKMLGGLTEQGTAISEDFDTSVAGILMEMQAKGELTKEQADEAAYVIKSIVNVKPSGKLVQAIKDATYNLTIANYLSAAQQLEDLSKTLLRGPSGFKNIVKSILGKAGIKMKDTGLNNLFDVVQKGGITDWNFKLSGFDMVDSLGKVSFLNTAYDSCVKQANGRRAIILQHRLTAMYGDVKGMEMFEKYKEGKLKTDEGLLDLDLMVDLLYQLGSTQPIYQSAMPTAYLNNPGVRLMYCLYSFSIKQVDWVIQGTKEVYQNQLLMGNNEAGAATVAGLRCIRSLTVVALFSALVGDLISTAKGDEEDTVRWNWINNGWKEGLKRLGINGFTGFLKIFNISRYDSYIFKREGLLGVLMSKLTPASVSIANDLINIAIGKEELSDLGRYGPLFLKPMYYIFKNNDMMPDYKLWEGGAGGSKSSKFGKTSVGTSGPVNTSKFGGYSVK